MISTNQFKNGMTIDMEGQLWTILEFQHVKPGKGGAFVRTKLKNVAAGQVLDKTFRAGEKFKQAKIVTKKMEYLYNTGEGYYFMDNETYEQVSVPKETIGKASDYLKENMEADFLLYKERIIGVTPPMFVELKVTKTDPGLKGDTVSGATKPATLETGLLIQVPLFINEKDTIRLDTRTNRYLERV